MVSIFDPKGLRDVAFIHAGLDYDCVLEDRILISVAKREALSAAAS